MKISFRIIHNTRRHISIQTHSIHSSSEYKIQFNEWENMIYFIMFDIEGTLHVIAFSGKGWTLVKFLIIFLNFILFR